MTAAIFGAAAGSTTTLSAIASYPGTGASQSIVFGFNPDAVFFINGNGTSRGTLVADSVRGWDKYIRFQKGTYAGEETKADAITATSGSGVTIGSNSEINNSGSTYYALAFKKRAGFFDVKTHSGNSTNDRAVAHDLGIAPAICAVMNRTSGLISSSNVNFPVWNGSAIGDCWPAWNDTTQFQALARFGSSNFTSSDIYLTSNNEVNGSGYDYVDFMFAEETDNLFQDTYSGLNSGNTTISHGSFSSPRFYIIKCSTTSGAWIVISPTIGTDKYLVLSDAATVVTSETGAFTFNSGSLVIKGNPSQTNYTGSGRNFRIWGFK